MRCLLCILLIVLLCGCGKPISDNTGSASETIAVIIGDNVISGTNEIADSDAPLRVTLYPCDYLPAEIGFQNISGAETITITDTTFISSPLENGWYNLIIEQRDSGTIAYLDSLYIDEHVKDTHMLALSEPIEVWGRVIEQSDFLSYVVAVGTPFYTDVTDSNRFYFSGLPLGRYNFASVEKVDTDTSPFELTLYPLVDTDGNTVEIKESSDSLIIQPK